jgi:hypothetical protein
MSFIYKKNVIYVKSCHICKIMYFMLNHVRSCQIMPFMSKHAVHVRSCHSCQIMPFMSNYCIDHKSYFFIHVKSCHSCQIIALITNHTSSYVLLRNIFKLRSRGGGGRYSRIKVFGISVADRPSKNTTIEAQLSI